MFILQKTFMRQRNIEVELTKYDFNLTIVNVLKRNQQKPSLKS